ncbi:nickel-binding protein [Tabrizicola sp.]|uniref:nickel-binding protein n=1 Tax=Tabrizicola sp. TaxID=2005166 RepID=UPI003F3E538F
MKTFLIERDVEGISLADLHGLIAANRRHAALMCDNGDLVHYMGSTFLPGDGRCLCLFQAKDEAVLSSLNAAARLPVERIVSAIALAVD